MRLAERLGETRRDFPLALDLGAHTGLLASLWEASGKVGKYVQVDGAYGMARQCLMPALVCDEEMLPFREESFDLVLSVMGLHAVNDLAGALIQINRTLKPDGLFLAVLPGARTLFELREILALAEESRSGGFGARVLPFMDVRDGGNLLQRAGFTLPMADSETLCISYASLGALLDDLRGMGESNILTARPRRPLSPPLLAEADALYRQRYGNGEGGITATVELLYLTGWKAHPSQPKAARRGSGTLSLVKVLGEGG